MNKNWFNNEIYQSLKMPSNLEGRTVKECQELALDIASDTFIKHGNKAIAFTDNDELRKSLGGRYQSYPELSLIMIAAYNEKQAELILSNL